MKTRAKVRYYHLTHTDIRHILYFFVFAFAFGLLFSSCFDEEFIPDSDVEVSFSQDTLRFDTVFTSLGSATRGISIKNPSDQNIIVSSIGLEKGDQSMFRINVDGISGSSVSDVLILANDSIYVFAEVTVDPDQPLSVSPFILQEQLNVKIGSRQQTMTLEAFGQNANYFPSRDARGQLIGLSCQNSNVVWDDPKPYVVFGLLFIDSCSLVIAPGTEVFVNGGLASANGSFFQDGGLVFLKDGRLESQGTIDNPITFQGARLEASFDNVSGQWAGLRFFQESTGNVIANTTIKNSSVGIRVDSAAAIDLSQVTIANTSNVGIIAVHATINADNLLVHSNGPQSCALVYGGDYKFRYTTLANNQNQAPALFLNNFNCVDPNCDVVESNALNVSFENSIITGSNDDEIELIDVTEGADPSMFNLTFDHTILTIDEFRPLLSDQACIDCIFYDDEPLFLDDIQDLYSLDTMSLARDQGQPIEGLDIDLLGKNRDPNSPDLGCFEF